MYGVQYLPWLESIACTGIVLLVMFPFQGSGGVSASIMGTVAGMNRSKILVAVGIGAFIGAGLVAFFLEALKYLFSFSWVVGLVALVIFLILAVIAYRHYKGKNVLAVKGGAKGA